MKVKEDFFFFLMKTWQKMENFGKSIKKEKSLDL